MINNIRSLKNSFKFAFNGLKMCILFERNFRIHIFGTITLFIIVFRYYNLTSIHISILILSCFLVLICEAFNTCIEIIMDNINKDYDLNIKYIKDIAASAVLLSSISVFIIVLLMLWDIDKILFILKSSLFVIPNFIFLIIYLLIGFWFIFLLNKDRS